MWLMDMSLRLKSYVIRTAVVYPLISFANRLNIQRGKVNRTYNLEFIYYVAFELLIE